MIDIVIPWVDGNDKDWKKEYYKYSDCEQYDSIRYESWNNLQYVFRGIEKNLPWVSKVFFVTWGHIPEWLNTEYSKLVIVKHEDFIPSKYLPTFNSNTIEMNYWRIESLSENFILFNDDLIPLKYIPPEYYFIDEIPCEEAVETHFILNPKSGKDYLNALYASINNMFIINKHFNKRDVVEHNKEKWFNPIYGERLNHNINLEYWDNFESFVYPHEAAPIKKSTLKEIWEVEPEFLDNASCNKVRSSSDVTYRLASIWQICKGEFVPTKYQGKSFHLDNTNYKEAIEAIRKKTYPIVCFNESRQVDFDELKRKINLELEILFPEKSKFEK